MNNFVSKVLIMLSVVALCVACEKYVLDEQKMKGFSGDIVVDNEDGSYFTDPNIRVTFSESLKKDGTYDLFLKKVKFSEKMPVRIDMTIPSVTKSATDTLSGDSIVPWAMGGPFEKWTIRQLSGYITYACDSTPLELHFEMLCGDYPVTYHGIYTEE
ncbi:MAG TPA: hypothetical protein PLS09_06360 [Paludibacteraceae bacterium]|jgi:hypothetical protein|nr:hypothetical protein [Paludibacteraceae bacterium]